MMNKSGIEWCDFTWNPITGCRHRCPYCYAARQAQRFCGDVRLNKTSGQIRELDNGLWELEKPFRGVNGKVLPLPVGFEPTMHRYRLDMPRQKKKSAIIFVGAMADIFGEWVPDEWIQDVIKECAAAPWHEYIFLTKNPERYADIIEYIEGEDSPLTDDGLVARFGATVTSREQLYEAYESAATWLSIEPIHEDISGAFEECSVIFPAPYCAETPRWNWIVIGAETGNRKGKVIPKREWIDEIASICKEQGVPLLMKNSLSGIMGSDFMQERPLGI